jgi:hypothetical protein
MFLPWLVSLLFLIRQERIQTGYLQHVVIVKADPRMAKKSLSQWHQYAVLFSICVVIDGEWPS